MQSFQSIARVTVAASALLGVVLLSGCDERYADNLHYGVRTDPLVLERFSATPSSIDAPGEFDKPGYLEHLSEVPADEKEKKLLDPDKLNGNQRDQLEQALEDLFGTPRTPTVKLAAVSDDDFDAPAKGEITSKDTFLSKMRLDDATLARGSELYRVHCLHCHGLSGNGRGPTAPWVNPHPRDYRPGKFKFTSTAGGNARKPRRSDLLRTLREGVEGTSMPSFGLLADDDLEAIVSYVIHLSIRGETEFNTIRALARPDSSGGDESASVADQVKTGLGRVASYWAKSESSPILPTWKSNGSADAMERSVKSGYQLFTSQKGGAGCIACHIDYGRQAEYMFDDWGTIVRPRDLTLGQYRGGRRPIDVYYRIHGGILGANMPAPLDLSPEQTWDLVNFVQILPYPEMRKKYGIDIDNPGGTKLAAKEKAADTP